MKNILLSIFCLLSLKAFSQAPEIKIVMFWETQSDLLQFQTIQRFIDTNLYKVEIASFKSYQDTALEYQVQTARNARVSPYQDSIKYEKNNTCIKFYCNKSGMCLGTLWATYYSIKSIDDARKMSINLRNDIVAYYEKKSKLQEKNCSTGTTTNR